MECISPLVKQIWVVAAILFQMIGNGMVIGISSSMLPALLADDSPIKTNVDQASWISSIIGTGYLVSCIISICVVATCGRRASVLIGLAPGILGPFICYFVKDANFFIFGRFVTGLCFGLSSLVAIVIGEFTSPEYRGVFLNLKSGAVYFGCMIVHILNHCVHWKTTLLITTVPYIVSFTIAYTWPESPAWLASKQEYDKCMNSFYWLRGRSQQSTKELTAMITAQKEQGQRRKTTLWDDFVTFMLRFKKNNFVKPMGVHFFATILMEFSGRHIFPAYAMQIINKMNPDNSHNFFYTLSMDSLMIVSALFSTALTKLLRRRTLLLTSGGLSVIILLFVCLFYYLRSISVISDTYDTVPLFIFGAYFVAINAGCTPICMTLVGEIFPIEHRPTAISMAGVLASLLMTLALKITPLMIAALNFYGTFSIFALIMCICLIILYFTLPETKDKTLQEVVSYFNSNKEKHLYTTSDIEARQKLSRDCE